MQKLIDLLSRDITTFLASYNKTLSSDISYVGFRNQYQGVLYDFNVDGKTISVFITAKDVAAHHYMTGLFSIAHCTPDDLPESFIPVDEMIKARIKAYETRMSDQQKHRLLKFFPSNNEVSHQNMGRFGALFTTPHCNVKCVFCKNIPPMGMYYQESMGVLKKTMLQLREEYESINFDGGEPTIYPHLIYAVHYAKSIGFKNIGLVTNGIRLADSSYLYALLDAGVNIINLSFVATTPESSKAIYGRSVIEEQYKALENLKKLRLRFLLTFQIIITRHNQDLVGDIFDVLTELNPENIIAINGVQLKHLRENILADLQRVNIVNHYDRLRNSVSSNIKLRHFPRCVIPKNYWEFFQFGDECDLRIPDKEGALDERFVTMDKAEICDSCIYKDVCELSSKLYLETYPDQTLYPITAD